MMTTSSSNAHFYSFGYLHTYTQTQKSFNTHSFAHSLSFCVTHFSSLPFLYLNLTSMQNIVVKVKDLVELTALNHKPHQLWPDDGCDSYISLHKSYEIKCKPSLLNQFNVTTSHLSLCGRKLRDHHWSCVDPQFNPWW